MTGHQLSYKDKHKILHYRTGKHFYFINGNKPSLASEALRPIFPKVAIKALKSPLYLYKINYSVSPKRTSPTFLAVTRDSIVGFS